MWSKVFCFTWPRIRPVTFIRWVCQSHCYYHYWYNVYIWHSTIEALVNNRCLTWSVIILLYYIIISNSDVNKWVVCLFSHLIILTWLVPEFCSSFAFQSSANIIGDPQNSSLKTLDSKIKVGLAYKKKCTKHHFTCIRFPSKTCYMIENFMIQKHKIVCGLTLSQMYSIIYPSISLKYWRLFLSFIKSYMHVVFLCKEQGKIAVFYTCTCIHISWKSFVFVELKV